MSGIEKRIRVLWLSHTANCSAASQLRLLSVLELVEMGETGRHRKTFEAIARTVWAGYQETGEEYFSFDANGFPAGKVSLLCQMIWKQQFAQDWNEEQFSREEAVVFFRFIEGFEMVLSQSSEETAGNFQSSLFGNSSLLPSKIRKYFLDSSRQ